MHRPETYITLFGFFTAFIWEIWQMPFFERGDMTAWQKAFGCTVASIGDAGIMVLAYLAASLTVGSRNWIAALPVRGVLAYLATGLVITIAIEHAAQRAPIGMGWRYSDLMPVILGTGLVPVAMWIVVPLMTLGLARWQSGAART